MKWKRRREREREKGRERETGQFLDDPQVLECYELTRVLFIPSCASH